MDKELHCFFNRSSLISLSWDKDKDFKKTASAWLKPVPQTHLRVSDQSAWTTQAKWTRSPVQRSIPTQVCVWITSKGRRNRHLWKTGARKEWSPWEWSPGLAWYGVARCGWLGAADWDHPQNLVPPVPLRGPSWEGSLFRAARRTNEWMSRSAGGPL